MVGSFLYLGDSSFQSGSCFEASTYRVRSNCSSFCFKNWQIVNVCLCSALLYPVEIWALKLDDILWLVKSDNPMLRWVCSGNICDWITMSAPRTWMSISSIEDTIHYNHLCWFGYLQQMERGNWSRKILHCDVKGSYPRGCPKKRWLKNIRYDLDKLQLRTSLTVDCNKYRNIKPSKHSAVSNPCQGKKGR